MDTSHHHGTSAEGRDNGTRRSPWTTVVVMLLLIGGFYLLREHWGHVAGYWPYLLLLACPLMHLFHGHGGHGGHGHHGGGPRNEDGSASKRDW
ncbi:DUF2933 domain-containing protein [Azohydromonas caseinilytica]|uniref:DUF2933 domain-containing protein n=1 Tax=Azohydromonas caseinilytica TaxID=2728836 RepID=UPI00197C8BFB